MVFNTLKPTPAKQLRLWYRVLFASAALTFNQKSAALPLFRGEMASEQMDVFCNSVFWVSYNCVCTVICYVYNFEWGQCGSKIKGKNLASVWEREIYISSFILRGNVTWPKSITCDSPKALLNVPRLTVPAELFRLVGYPAGVDIDVSQFPSTLQIIVFKAIRSNHHYV